MLTLSIGPTGGATRRRPPYFKTKKLGLLGSTQSIHYAPWADPTWTLAAHPCSRPNCKREPDWYFDLHRRACFEKENKSWNRQYYTWLKALQTPIFMQEDWPEIPMAVRYPLERITAEFSTAITGRLYATNHCAYLIALAMTEGVTTIGLFGCQYSADSEHGVQRDSLTYWLGRFEQWGGRIVVPPKYNSLLSQPKGLYGYDSHDEHGKLVAEYQAKAVTVTKPTRKGPDERSALQVLAHDEAPKPTQLMDIKEPPAWERSPWPELVGVNG